MTIYEYLGFNKANNLIYILSSKTPKTGYYSTSTFDIEITSRWFQWGEYNNKSWPLKKPYFWDDVPWEVWNWAKSPFKTPAWKPQPFPLRVDTRLHIYPWFGVFLFAKLQLKSHQLTLPNRSWSTNRDLKPTHHPWGYLFLYAIPWT